MTIYYEEVEIQGGLWLTIFHPRQCRLRVCQTYGIDEKSKAARVDEKDNDDRTPLHHAVLNGHVESCRHYSSHQHEPPYSSDQHQTRHCRGREMRAKRHTSWRLEGCKYPFDRL